MKKRLATGLILFLMFMLAAAPALAADVFRFAEETVQVYAGDSITPELKQDGKFADGTVVYSVNKTIGTVDEYGTLTAVSPGELYLTAELIQDGKTAKRCRTKVTIYRKVEKVELSTKGLQVYEPDDGDILSLLSGSAADGTITDRILVIPSGKAFWPRATVWPEDVASAHKKVTFETSDPSVLKLTGDGQYVAKQPGECILTVRSKQSPEITEQFYVLVTQPVKKVVISGDAKSVGAGRTLQLWTTVTPENATVRQVVWSSRNEKVATVDENGLVTGVSRGDVIIEAKTTDGTNLTAQYSMSVTQDVTDLAIQETDVTVATKKSAPQLHVQLLPQNASNRKLIWTSSDETVATVNGYGSITGRRAGECVVTCTSASNPEISASIPVYVIQPVTDIRFITPAGLSFHIGESRALEWQVLPEDATVQEVTFKSRAPKVAVVDANGIVTGLEKGQADIEVRATDGSNKYRVYRVTVLKPVEGINPMAPQYYAQLGGSTNIKATVYPSDASEIGIDWESSDPYVATIQSVGKSYGRIYGQRPGYTTVTAITRDGGFSTTTEVVVDDFNGMVMCGSAYIDEYNKIRMIFWNMSRNFTVNSVSFRVDCYDTLGNPIVCTADGATSFDGSYPLPLEPGARTEHGRFNYYNYRETGLYGYVVVTITGFTFDNGQEWWIPEEQQVPYRSTDSYHWGEPTPDPGQPAGYTEEGNG